MSATTQRPPLPYSKYIVIMITVAIVLWVIAGVVLDHVPPMLRVLAEGIFVVALSVCLTLAAAMVWCTGHVVESGAAAPIAVAQVDQFQQIDRATAYQRIVASAPVQVRSPFAEVDTRPILQAVPEPDLADGAAAKIYELGREAERKRPRSPA